MSHALFRNAQQCDAPLYGAGISGSTVMSQPPIIWIMEALGKKEKTYLNWMKAKIFSWQGRPFQHRNGPEAPASCWERAASGQRIYPNQILELEKDFFKGTVAWDDF